MPIPPRYIEFPLEGGGSILIETPDQQEKNHSGFVKTGPGEAKEAPLQAEQSFDASVENVRKAAELLVSKLRAISAQPDEMTVSFGLKASGDFGTLAVGKVGGEVNYAVMLKWKKEEKKEEGKKKEEEGKKEESHEKKEEGEHKAPGSGEA